MCRHGGITESDSNFLHHFPVSAKITKELLFDMNVNFDDIQMEVWDLQTTCLAHTHTQMQLTESIGLSHHCRRLSCRKLFSCPACTPRDCIKFIPSFWFRITGTIFVTGIWKCGAPTRLWVPRGGWRVKARAWSSQTELRCNFKESQSECYVFT